MITARTVALALANEARGTQDIATIESSHSWDFGLQPRYYAMLDRIRAGHPNTNPTLLAHMRAAQRLVRRTRFVYRGLIVSMAQAPVVGQQMAFDQPSAEFPRYQSWVYLLPRSKGIWLFEWLLDQIGEEDHEKRAIVLRCRGPRLAPFVMNAQGVSSNELIDGEIVAVATMATGLVAEVVTTHTDPLYNGLPAYLVDVDSLQEYKP